MHDPLPHAWTRLRDWIAGAALPFWAGIQEPSGAWPEALHLDGAPDRGRVRRHRVQARQVITYALATRRGWHDGDDVIRATVDHMWRAGRSEEPPGLAHRLHADGTVADARRDLYDHAFYLLALGWAEAVVGGQERRIADTVAFLDSLAHPSGGFREGEPARLPRRQNPHMHLFEATLALSELGVPGDWRARADRLHALFGAHVFDPRLKAVREFFDAGWAWDGGTLEPGHACEWVWLLAEYEALTDADTRARRDALYQTALLSGAVWLLDEVDHEGEAVRETSRLWVQCELVKAHLAQSRDGVPGARGMAAAAVHGLLDGWLEPRGTWVDQRGACGQRVSRDIPTSTFYHIAVMAAAVEDAVKYPPSGPTSR